jgi:hypothetical protein
LAHHSDRYLNTMDDFQGELKRTFLQQENETRRATLQRAKPNPTKFLVTWASFKNYFYIALFLMFFMNLSLVYNTLKTFQLIEEVSHSEKGWVEKYKLSVLKLENSLHKLFLNQRDFLSGEISRNINKERLNLVATQADLSQTLASLEQSTVNEYPELHANLKSFRTKFQEWSNIQEEIDKWVTSGDPDTANTLFFEQGSKARGEVSEPFQAIKDEIARLVQIKYEQANSQRNSLKKKMLSLCLLGGALNILVLLGFIKLNNLLSRFTDYLRRWIFASRKTDTVNDLERSLNSLQKNLFTLKSRLWGLKADERSPRPGQEPGDSTETRKAS